MAAQSQKLSEPSNMKLVFVAVGVFIALIVLIGVGRHYLAGSAPSMAQKMDLDKHPIPAWVTQAAEKCQGDITKLSPEERQKVEAAYQGNSRIVITAAYAVRH